MVEGTYQPKQSKAKMSTRKSHMMPTKLAEAIVAAHPELNVSAAKFQQVCEAMFEHVIDLTKKDEKVTFPNFLKLERVKRNERTFRNPKGDEPVVKPERYVLVASIMGSTKKEFEEIEVDTEWEAEREAKRLERIALSKTKAVAAEKPAKPAKSGSEIGLPMPPVEMETDEVVQKKKINKKAKK